MQFNAADSRSLARRFIAKLKAGDLTLAVRRRVQRFRARQTGTRPIRAVVDLPTASSVIAIDPSEAVRSARYHACLAANTSISWSTSRSEGPSCSSCWLTSPATSRMHWWAASGNAFPVEDTLMAIWRPYQVISPTSLLRPRQQETLHESVLMIPDSPRRDRRLAGDSSWLFLAVLALAILLGRRASPLWLGLLAAGIGGVVLLARPVLGLPALVLAALAVPIEFGTGTDVKLNPASLLVPGCWCIWLLDMVRRRQLQLAASPVNRPLAPLPGRGPALPADRPRHLGPRGAGERQLPAGATGPVGHLRVLGRRVLADGQPDQG